MVRSLSVCAAMLLLWLTACMATAPAGAARSVNGQPIRPSSSAEPPATVSQTSASVAVAIDPNAPGPAVPQRFLGLSFEMAALRQLVQYAHRGDLVALLRSLGPGMLRFGGITADENVAWSDPSTPRPSWASSAIGPADMRALGELARRSGWQILLTVGLAHFEPQAAAREVASAHHALGPYLAAVEIGNEPDAYGKHGFRELPWIAQGYEEEVGAYREAIAALTPGVPIAGPDVSGSGVFTEWGEEEAYSQHPALLTGHHYPLGCAQTPAPSIEALLSPYIRNREALSLKTYLKVARAGGVQLRIDEANTVSCGGVPGISNTFASALWATSYITQAMAAGAAGINLQGNPTRCIGYTPLCAPDQGALAKGLLRAQPEWYALLLTRSLVGEHPVPATISTPAGPEPEEPVSEEGQLEAGPSSGTGPSGAKPPNLVAGAFAGSKRTLQVVLVDDEPPSAGPMDVSLTGLYPGRSTAQVLRLAAPAPSAIARVTLAGDAVTPDGIWGPHALPARLAVDSGALALQLDPSSAALVTVSPCPAPPRRHPHGRSARRSAC